MNRLCQAIVALAPLTLAPALLYALAEGWVDAGGGEKDILLIFPYALWSLVFGATALVLIAKRVEFKRWLTRSVAIAFATLIGLGVIAYAVSWLGVG